MTPIIHRVRPVRTARLAAVTLGCAALMLAGTPADAAPRSTGSAATSQLGTATDGRETPQVEQLLPETDVLSSPRLGTAPPVTGGENPGATLGQGVKTLASTDHLSAASERLAREEVSKAKAGQTPQTLPDRQTGQDEGTAGAAAATSTSAQRPTASLAGVVTATAAAWQPSGIQGMDVSGWQPVVDWAAEYANGARFAYIKATEGSTYASSAFSSQYAGATNAGLYRGAYHFALPSQSSGAAQARYFVANGGGWSADGATLPGLLDIEYNPYSSLGDTCYGMSASQMNSWIASFTDTYRSLTGRYPAIYTTTDWWSTCTGNTSQFSSMPLHIARYATSAGTMPSGWSTYDIWQYTDSGVYSGDSDVFGGTAAQLADVSKNSAYTPRGGTSPRSTYVSTAGYAVNLKGAIGAAWKTARSTYGEPITNEVCGLTGGGCFQKFSSGYSLYWTSGTGVHSIYRDGAIGTAWKAAGSERNYGYPVTERYASGRGLAQRFSGGRVLTGAS